MTRILFFILIILLISACGETEPSGLETATAHQGQPRGNQAQTAAEEGTPAVSEAPGRPTLDQVHRDIGIPLLTKHWSGDLDELVKKRVIRVLTVYGPGTYYINQGQEKGIVYEVFKAFEDQINKQEGKKVVRVHVLFIPVARDELIPGLLEGRGDIAAAALTITPARQKLVDFTDPLTRELSEVLVTGPAAPGVSVIADLAGKDIYVRASSSYRSSLNALNLKFVEEGRAPMQILDIAESLEDEDILELVSNGSLEWAVVDDYKADIWAGVFEDLVVRKDIVFREGGQLGYAIRKDSPLLMGALNRFVSTHRQGTLKGNILINRYFRDFDWTRNALMPGDYKRFLEVANIFEMYGEQYGFDYLLITAQGYQESRLDQSARSPAGAIGIMQLLPSTAADPNVGIPDIGDKENNIHAGIKYLNFIRDRYFNDPEMDILNRTYFALAAYNAGPARIAGLRAKAEQQGYNPDIWFDNVEIIAAREIGSETVSYVANILKYYVVYRLSLIRALQRYEAREAAKAN